MGLSRKASAVFDVKEAIKSIFAAFDADGNGTLDRQELETFARAFRKNEELNDGEDNVDKMMAAMDFKNSDGTVQIEEFETYLQAILMAKFASYDHDGDKTLTIDEMLYVVQDLVDPHSKEAKRPHFMQKKKKFFMKKFDKDHGDTVSPFEFQAFFLEQMNRELTKWTKDTTKPLPYMLRKAVNVNPGQVSKQVRQLEEIAAARVAEAQEAGEYFTEEMAEEELIDLVDVKDTEEMVQSEHVPVQQRATETGEMMSAAKTRKVEEDFVVKQAEAEALAAYIKCQAILAQASFMGHILITPPGGARPAWMMIGAVAAVAVAGIFAYRRFKN